MAKMLRDVRDCHAEAERNACLRIEQSLNRMVRAAVKRRNAIESKMGPGAPNSAAYLVAAHECMVLMHWQGWIKRNCDYRRMQADMMPGRVERGKQA